MVLCVFVFVRCYCLNCLYVLYFVYFILIELGIWQIEIVGTVQIIEHHNFYITKSYENARTLNI